MRLKSDPRFQVAAIVTSSAPPRPEVAIVVKGSFRLVPDGVVDPIATWTDGLPISGDLFAEGDDDRVGACAYPSDLAERKLSAEIMVVGHAYAPRGEPVTELPVLVKLGSWSKMLRVVGPRTWTEGLLKAFTDPQPFTKAPLGWEHAFGGPDFDDNPAGKGLAGPELPTLELAGDVLRSRSDRPRPACLGPINPAWKSRASRVGKDYGPTWAATRKPFRSADFDWRHFHAAPQDQWLEGFAKGDEELTLQNLSATTPILKTRLPGLRVRAFVKDDTGAVREAKLSLDTIVVDTDKGVVALTWRGHLPVRETDLDDVKIVYVAAEPAADAPLPDAHHHAKLAAFEADPAGLRDAVPPEYHAAFFKDEPPPGPVDDNPIVALLDKRLPGALGDKRADVKRAADASLKDERVRAKVDEVVAEVEKGEGDEPPVPPGNRPGTFPELHLRRKMRRILEQAEKVRAAFDGKDLPDAHRAKLAELERLPHDPKWKTFDPEYTAPVEPISTEEPGPGRDLSEQDLTGRDLSGMDLSKADLRQAVLTRANLRGANLSGANLRGAVLFRADLTGANLAGANLTRTNACRAVCDDANLSGATLEQAFFDGASLKNANLTRATGEYAMFMKADAGEATFADASLPHADFTGARLEGARFPRASVTKAAFADVRASGASFQDATLSGSGFGRADLRSARLYGTRAEHAFFIGANLDEADLSFSVLVGSHFTEASAKKAVFFGANLREARLYRASLEDARFEKANLFSADLCKARVDRVSFRGASLYDARLLGTSGKDTDFKDAVLHRSTLVR